MPPKHLDPSPAALWAEGRIAELEDAGDEYRRLVTEEARLEDERAGQKQAAVLRLLELQNPTQPGKLYSATTAESMASTDPEYSGYLRRLRDTVANKNAARTRVEAAKLRAQLAIAVVQLEASTHQAGAR